MSDFIILENKSYTYNASVNRTTIVFDVCFASNEINGFKIASGAIDLQYDYTKVVASKIVSQTFTYTDDLGQSYTANVWDFMAKNLAGASANGLISFLADPNLMAYNPIIDADGKIVTVTLEVEGEVNAFDVSLEKSVDGGETVLQTIDKNEYAFDGGTSAIVVDTIAPTIAQMTLGAIGKLNGTLNEGDVLNFVVQMSESIVVTGSPLVTFAIGGVAKTASYVSGSGSKALLFTYTIAAEDSDTDGISIAANALDVNGGTIKDEAGFDAILTSPAMADNAFYKVDSTVPNVPTLTFSDTGISTSDGITNNNTITVAGVEESATWQFSIDGGATWQNGFGENFALVAGTYAANSFKVKQTDAAGNVSGESALASQIVIDATAPVVPTLTITDTGFSATDGITTLGTVTVDGIENSATWQYSTNGGTTWSDGTETSFALAAGTYVANSIKVRQVDIAGNMSSEATFASRLVVDTVAPTLTTSTPSDNATAVAIDSNIVLTFSEAVKTGNGNIVISDGTDTRTINVTDTTQVVFDGNKVTINPTDDLQADATYNVQMASGVITDAAGNAYAGISDATTLDLTTKKYFYNGHTYLLSKAGSWLEAEAEAVSLGGHLVTINDQAEQAWIESTFLKNDLLWIGYTDQETEGIFKWVSGENSNYTNWNTNEPNNLGGNEDYVHLFSLDWESGYYGKWNDLPVPNYFDEIRFSSMQGIIEINNNLPEEVFFSYSITPPDISSGYYYPDNNNNQLCDGFIGGNSHYDDLGNGSFYEWVGWYVPEPTINFIFEESVSINSISIGFLSQNLHGISLPKQVIINGESFSLSGNELLDATRGFINFDTAFIGTELNITLIDNNENRWIFVDEIKFQFANPDTSVAPTLTAFTDVAATIPEDSHNQEITFATLAELGNEADSDGTVEAFVVKSVNSGSLLIGTNAATATPWNVSNNNTIDATHHAYWSAANNANGNLNAFSVVAKDNSGAESLGAVAVTVHVQPLNDPPALVVSNNAAVNEGALLTHHITLNDPDADTYAVTINWGDGSEATNFEATDHSFDIFHIYGDNGVYNASVTVNDQQGESQSIESASFTATVRNVAPTAQLTGNDRLNSGETYLLRISNMIEPGADTRTAYNINWGDGNTTTLTPEELESAEGIFTHTFTATKATQTTRTITVSATDEDGTFVMGTKAITVNRPAQNITLSAATLFENSAAGTVVGTLSTIDDEAGSFTYSLLDNAEGRFLLEGTTIKVAENSVLDFESAPTHTIKVRSTDQWGMGIEKEFTISLADVSPDLIISAITTPQGLTAINAGSVMEISWTLQVQGSETSQASWVDRVYFDNPNTPYLDYSAGEFAISAPLSSAEAIERVQTIQVPVSMSGEWRIAVVADVYNSVQENIPELDNNVAYGTVLFDVLTPNLHVEQVTAPSSTFTGKTIEVEWVVKNSGEAPTISPLWYDGVYLSSDPILDNADTYLTAVRNASYLAIDNEYRNSATVTLPGGREGTYYIIVKADSANYVYEGSYEHDNATSSSAVEIQPIPISEFSDLGIVAVATPYEALSGQNMLIQYSIENEGQAALPSISSTLWIESIYMSSDTVLDSNDRLLKTISRVLAPEKLPLPTNASTFTTTESVSLPIGIEGNFYFFVTIKPLSPISNLYESNDKGYDVEVVDVNLTPPPDLNIIGISSPTTAVAGHNVTVTWGVINSGSTTTPNGSWREQLYLSRDTVLGSGDYHVSDFWHSGALSATRQLPASLDEALSLYNAGSAEGYYINSVTFRVADDLQGEYYLIAATDTNNEVFELDNGNNIAAHTAPITIASYPADLLITEATAAQAAQAGTTMRVTWSVTNQGTGETTTSTWYDRVILSSDTTLGNSDDISLGNFSRSSLLNINESYTRNELVSLPYYLSGYYNVYVVTDVNNHAYESNNNNNSYLISPQLRVIPIVQEVIPNTPAPPVQIPGTPDLEVSAVTASAEVASGTPLTVTYTVRNIGLGRTNSEYWWDNVTLSSDEELGNADDLYLGRIYHSNRLAPEESYQTSASFTIPIDWQGSYYLFVATDASGYVSEPNAEDNNIASTERTSTITLSPTPDLVITLLQSPIEITGGQTATINWNVRNNGAAATTGGWRQAFYLSRDTVLDRSADIYVGYADSTSPLSTTSEVTLQQSFQISNKINDGTYYLFAVVDSSNAIYERGKENNNTFRESLPLHITKPAPADLVVDAIEVPEDGASGMRGSITYSVINQSTQALSGSWYDSIYLSTDAVWDINDTLFSRVALSETINGGERYAQTASGIFPGVIGGDYSVIVRSDIFNQVTEDNDNNNLTVSDTTIHMDVAKLTLGTTARAEFTESNAVYYRVDVAAGETLSIDFDRLTSDGRTELFVSYGKMPGRAEFDYRYTIANSPDQHVDVAHTKDGSYYIMAYNAYGNQDDYAITANTLNFSIAELGTTAGSNKGQVTVRIDGARFTTNTEALLIGTDGVEHTADSIYWKDSTTLWATFDLRGLAVGAYDVTLEDGEKQAVVDDGFTVTNGERGHIEYGMETPSSLRVGQIGTVRVFYQNIGETDAVAPLLNVFGNAFLKQTGETAFGDTSLQLLGISDEGPAGIVAPGAQGSFQLFFTPDFSGGGTVTLDVASLKPNEAIDWSSLLATKPDNISQDAWEGIKADMIDQLGSATNGYQQALAENATALDMLENRTDQVADLLAMEYQQATNYGGLVRSETIGVLGYQQTFEWDFTAREQQDKSVLVTLAGSTMRFQKNGDGTYALAGAGTATLSRANGAFELHQHNGTTILFNLDGAFAELRDSNGNTLRATYEEGLLQEVAGSNGDIINFTYNEAGRLTEQTDQTGRTISYSYDSENLHLAAVTSPEGSLHYSYVAEEGVAQHQISSITLPNGTVHHFDYDASGRVCKEYLNDGAQSITYTYVGANEIIATDANGVSTHVWLNEHGQIAQVEDALGAVSQLHYDTHGNVTDIVNPDGTIQELHYDNAGRIVESQNALGQTINFAYNAQFGHVAQVTDQRDNATNYSYDSYGNLGGITYADSSSESYSYNAHGDLQVAVNRRGESIRYTFNADDQLTQKSFADGTTATYTYDIHGNLTSAVDADSATTFEYNSADRLIKVTDNDGRWLSYSYNNAGQRIAIADQAGHETHYSYNELGNLSQVNDEAGDSVAAYSYDATGHLLRSDNGNGTFTTYSYDTAEQITHLTNYQADGTINSYFDYTYDSMGRRTEMKTLDGTTHYDYDALGQLIGVTLPDGQSIEYRYDAAGNRISVTENSATTNYLTNNLNQYSSVGNTLYSYDADGNLASKTENGITTSYNYNAENQLVAVTTPTDTWHYEYDALGNRIATIHNDERVEYQLDLTDITNVAGEYDSAGNALARYTYGIGLESQSSNNAAYYYDFNAIGSTAGLTNGDGSYVNQYSYLPFGENLVTNETIANPFEYVGQWGVMDEGNGLDFMRARYYSAEEGRFMQQDTIGVGGGLNLYSYSGNSPLNYVDPTGYFSWSLFGKGVLNVVGSGLAIAVVVATAPASLTVGAAIVASAVALRAGWSIGTGINQMVAAARDESVPFDGGLFEDMTSLSGNETAKSVASVADSVFDLASGRILSPQKSGKLFELGIENTSSLLEKSDWTVSIVNNGLSVWDKWSNTYDVWDQQVRHNITIVRPSDPNDITGPEGFGEKEWINAEQPLYYAIHFENEPTATAPAQQVLITQTLDSDLNPYSFRLEDFGWGDIYVDVPDNTAFYINRLDLRDTKGYMVDVVASIDITTHKAFWSFTTIDPATGEIPEDPNIGFLPINAELNKGLGEGFVSYSVNPDDDAPTGTVIDAEATIVFTTQEPIDTPAIFNTLDMQAPESHVEANNNGSTIATAQFVIRWSGSDVGSAIAGYSLYVSDNGSDYTLWLDNTTLNEATFVGEAGHSYSFYSIATDNAGNKEAAPEKADLTITIAEYAMRNDTAPPEITVLTLPADGVYAIGDSLEISLKFSEAVAVDIVGLPPAIVLTIGESTVKAKYESGSGTNELLFSYTVAAGDYAPNGIIVGDVLQTNGATLRDIAGNPLVELTLPLGSTSGIHVANPPVIAIPLIEQSVAEQHEFLYQLPADAFVDADANDSLTYNAALDNDDSLPAWLHFNAETLTFSGTPHDGDAGLLNVKVTATDEPGLQGDDTFALMVTDDVIPTPLSRHTLSGNITFWKDIVPVSGVSLQATSVTPATHEVQFRNVELHADGSRTVELWVNSSNKTVQSVQVELELQAGSTATWQNAAHVPSSWNVLANTETAGYVKLGGIGTTALSPGSTMLGTLTLSAPADTSRFELALNSGVVQSEALTPFSLTSAAITSDAQGHFSFAELQQSTYAIEAGNDGYGDELDHAVTVDDALATLMLAVGLNPNNDGGTVSEYQFLAADVNRDGKVRATDALNILKMALDIPTAPEKEWLFTEPIIVPQVVGFELMNRNHVIWSLVTPDINLNRDMPVALIGFVTGDVDGSWSIA